MRHLQSTNIGIMHSITVIAAVTHWVRAFALPAEDWVFESQPREA